MNSEITVWQRALAEAFTNIDSLCQHLQIDVNKLPQHPSFKAFPLRVTRSYVDCMEPGNPADPLLRQVLPISDEVESYPGYSDDPVGDLKAIAIPGVIHKYQGRVLLIVTGACAIHCRYCFRKNFPYAELQLSNQKIQQAIELLARNTDITEVILSGGDPLLLNDDKLGKLITQLASIPHIKRLRIHSRVPIVLPSRITPSLMKNLRSAAKQIVMVTHANHANELSHEVKAACQRMTEQDITLLNQSVLLKGVNDNPESLCTLSEKLFSFKILPYYLHLLDKANGVGHFAVTETSALALHQQMRIRLPGYLVPRLVQEQSGAAYKIPLFES